MAETRQRILTAASKLMHSSPIWNWRDLSIRAVAKRAGINERTVYRHFSNERKLRDAVLLHFEEEAGIELPGLRLEEIGDLTRRMLEYVSAFPFAPRTPRDPSVAAANKRQRAALLAAVAQRTKRWPAKDRAIAAGMFDVLWSTVSYERLVVDWKLDSEDAIRGITWVMGLIEAAIRNRQRPDS